MNSIKIDYMKKSLFSKVLSRCLLSASLVCLVLGQQSCLDEYAPGNYYTFTGETVASFLEHGGKNVTEADKDRFSYFIQALKRSGAWGELSTYGEYTCFAPTNDGFAKYFAQRGVSSIDELSDEACDTIAFTHLISQLFFCRDLSDGALPYPNMMNRYLVYVTDSVTNEETGEYEIVYRLNQSYIVERDDSVQNGVVHIIAEALNPSNKFLPDVMEMDESISLFNEALELTKMRDSLVNHVDSAYHIQVDSIVKSTEHKYGTSTEVDYWVFPQYRYFKYTAFVEKNSTFEAEGINDINDLIAESIIRYDTLGMNRGKAPRNANGDIIPMPVEDVRKGYYYEDEYTSRSHPLNKFVSYHLLPEQLQYNEFNIVDAPGRDDFRNSFCQWGAIDVEDFYETMLPHSVMRISAPQTGGRYINRKGAPADQYNGQRMITGVPISSRSGINNDNTAINGVYHYITRILWYDSDTRNEALNCRMRIMCSTLSPDFINSGGRGRYSELTNGGITYGHKTGFCKNVIRSEQTEAWVRYYNPVFSIFRSDEVTIRGNYDVAFKIPPVPSSGEYELRMFMCTLTENSGKSDRGVVQIYLGEQEDGMPEDSIVYTACDIPVDLAIDPKDPRIGWEDDKKADEKVSEQEAAEYNMALDKALRNHGYMKGMDSYNYNYGTGGTLRARADCVRKILTTSHLSDKKDYWFRIRLVTDDPTGVCAFNCIEVVPKSVYANEKYPEDQH